MSLIRDAGKTAANAAAAGGAVSDAHEPEPTPEQKRGMRATIRGQAFGALGQVAFGNGLMLLYLTQQEFSNAAIMFFLALPALTQTLCIIPAGHLADRRGLKKVMVSGSLLACLGFAMLPTAGFFSGLGMTLLISAGIITFAVGIAMFSSGWFALLQPIVPRHMRGRYFGIMRVVWQFTGLVFGVVCTFVLTRESPTAAFQIIFAVVTLGMLTRTFYTAQVPELEQPETSRESMWAALLEIVRVPGYASFCCYVFLITLSTANAPNLFALIEKDALNFGNQAIIWMGNSLMIGAVLGFWLGGKAVDRLGTKVVFLMAHFAYGLVLIGFLARILIPAEGLHIWLGLLNFLFGLISAASTIAVSTEMMALIPQRNKSLSTGLLQTLQVAGGALSGLLSAAAINLNVFASEWRVAGERLSGYDSMLLLNAVLVLVLTVALGLVPSVIRRTE